jgi:hypothetical protein
VIDVPFSGDSYSLWRTQPIGDGIPSHAHALVLDQHYRHNDNVKGQ